MAHDTQDVKNQHSGSESQSQPGQGNQPKQQDQGHGNQPGQQKKEHQTDQQNQGSQKTGTH